MLQDYTNTALILYSIQLKEKLRLLFCGKASKGLERIQRNWPKTIIKYVL